jgi:hypothetical protein
MGRFATSMSLTGTRSLRYLRSLSFATHRKVVVEKNITWIVHLSSILSARGEQNTKLAIDLNMRGIENVMEVEQLTLESYFR